MRGDSNTGTLLEEVLDGGNRSTDTGVISYVLTLEGHVEVATDQHLKGLRGIVVRMILHQMYVGNM